jgi:hypothetical protein
VHRQPRMAYWRSIRGMQPRLMTTTHLTGRPPASRNRPRRNPRALHALPLLVSVVLAVAAVAFIAYVLWPRWPGPPVPSDAPALPITIAGVTFNLPPAAVRVPVQRRPGAHERVDLAFLWPSLDPPAAAANSTAPAAAPAAERTLERVFVTIAAAGDKLAPGERVKTIYPRYVAAEPEPGPGGLAVLAFRTGTPYQGEDLIYDAAGPANFLVRCSRNGAGPTPGTCLYEQRIEGADLVVRFPRDWLADWGTVASNIGRLIGKLRRAPR